MNDQQDIRSQTVEEEITIDDLKERVEKLQRRVDDLTGENDRLHTGLQLIIDAGIAADGGLYRHLNEGDGFAVVRLLLSIAVHLSESEQPFGRDGIPF